jgi:protein-tyrosine phosphatase
MIDIHSHILPGIDDGPKDMEETAQMLRLAIEEGITDVIATSHGEAGFGEHQAKEYLEAFEKTREYIVEHKLPIQLYYGNELYYGDGIIEALRTGEVRTLNGTRYVLVEFPVYESCSYIERGLRELQKIGCWPILAHAERYPSIRDVKKIRELTEQGVLIQINAGSIIGKLGVGTKRFCLKLMKNDLVHVVATDAHGSLHRKPAIKDCIAYIQRKKGNEYCRMIMEDHPRQIIEGELLNGKD